MAESCIYFWNVPNKPDRSPSGMNTYQPFCNIFRFHGGLCFLSVQEGFLLTVGETVHVRALVVTLLPLLSEPT